MSKHRILFSKGGTARYISHLDLMRTLQRGFLRAGISIRHTEGYHPHPYTSIPLPLPLGFSSECELMEFGLLDGATPETLPALMNAALPAGITVQQCYEDGLPFKKLSYVRYAIRMELERGSTQETAAAFQALLSRESHVITKRSKKAKSGQVELDIIPLIHSLEALHPENGVLSMDIILQAQNPGLNPDLLVGAFRNEYPDLAPGFVTFHRKEILDDDLQPYR